MWLLFLCVICCRICICCMLLPIDYIAAYSFYRLIIWGRTNFKYSPKNEAAIADNERIKVRILELIYKRISSTSYHNEDIHNSCFLDQYNLAYINLRARTIVLKPDFRFGLSKQIYIFWCHWKLHSKKFCIEKTTPITPLFVHRSLVCLHLRI